MIRDYGDRALLLECESTDEVLALTAALNAAQIPGVLDVVPASRTVLLELAGPRDQAPTRQLLARLQVDPAATAANDDGHIDVVIDVVYDGADLADVAELTGLDVPGVIEAHTATPWRCRIRWIRTGFRLPGGRRPATGRAAAQRAAHQGAGRVGGTGRGVQRRLPASVARRLAADRAHRRGAVGRRPPPAGAADARYAGAVPGRLRGRRDHAGSPAHRAAGPGRRPGPAGPGARRRDPVRGGRPLVAPAGQPSGGQPRRPRNASRSPSAGSPLGSTAATSTSR